MSDNDQTPVQPAEEDKGQGAARLAEDGLLMRPQSIAEAYWRLHTQTRDAWTFEADLRPFAEQW